MSTHYQWNERYNNDRYGLEQKSSFKYFQMYLREPKPRNLKEFHKRLSEYLSEKGLKKIPTYKSICDYSHKWKWNKRAEAYDQYIQNKEDEELKALFHDIKKENLNNKAYASARNSEAYNNEIRSLTELYNDGKDVQEIEADFSASSIVEVKEKSVFEELKELDNELESVYADKSDKQGQD